MHGDMVTNHLPVGQGIMSNGFTITATDSLHMEKVEEQG